MTNPIPTFLYVLLFALILSSCQLQPSPTENQTPAVQTPTATEAPTPIQTLNQTKTIDQTYTTPGGEEIAHFTFTLNGTTIEKIDLNITSTNQITQKMQTAFAGGINDIVTGKDISEIEELDVVSGSSLTSGAFNQALDRLQQELKTNG